jgi:hypothetical protein
MQGYEIRRYRPGDEHALLDTFNLVFGASDPAFQPRSLEEWRWQYEENPAGMRLWLALKDGVVAASFAAQPNRVLAGGRQVIFGQLIDSMVHPEHRLGLKRPGLFVETAWRMLADQRSDPVVFGYPNQQAWRIGRMFLRYDFVRRQHVQFRELGGLRVGTPREVERIASFGPEVGELYERCAREWGASVVRDEAYLNWRFARHPRFRYRMLAVRDGERLAGYAVYRPGNWPMPGVGMLIDFLVPSEEVEVGRLLRDAVLAEALADGVPLVVQVLPEWSPWCERFQRWHWPVFPTDYLMGGCIADPRFDMYFLRDRWWYTLAELDLV